MPNKKSRSPRAKNKPQRRLIGVGRPASKLFNPVLLVPFIAVFVAIGGYLLYSAIYASGNPEIQLAMSNYKYCLDDYGDASGVKGNPATVDAYACNGRTSQAWAWDGSTIRIHNQCLDVDHQATGNGSRVDLFPCNGGRNQAWHGSGSEIIGNQSGKCLEAPAFKPNVSLDLWSCNGGDNQHWRATTYSSTGGGGGSSVGYYNPFVKVPNLSFERFDGGLDFGGTGQVYAIGDGVVTNVAAIPNDGWLGVFLVYRLTSGKYAGTYIYTAEGCTPEVGKGANVEPYNQAGSKPICNMHAPIETGIAVPTSPGHTDLSANEASLFAQILRDLGLRGF
jgi:hypothetical protein